MNFNLTARKTSPIFFLCFLFCSTLCFASFELKGFGARARGMGQAYVGLANTADALFLNCGGCGQIQKAIFSFFIARPFGLKELSHYSFAGIVPTSLGNFAMGLSQFGNKSYQEQSIIFNYSRASTTKFFYGANLHYMKLQIEDYGSDFSFGIDLGLLIKINSKISWGFFATNINRASIGNSRELLPQTFVAGICVRPLDNLTINFDWYEELPFPLELRGGVEYIFLKKIAVRSGFISTTSEFCFGLGFIFSRFNCDYALNTHPDLGLTHQFSLQLGLNKQ